MNKVTYVVLEQTPIIILYSKPVLCMSKNGYYTKHTIQITRIVNFVRNGEE